MRPQLQAMAGCQGGVFLRRQALESGYAVDEIRGLLRAKRWLRVRHGAYVGRELHEQLDEAGRGMLLVRAVSLVVKEPAVFSHTSASLLQRQPTWGMDLDTVHLTRTSTHSGRIVAAVNHHEASLEESEIEVVDGLRCTTLHRTPLDVTRQFGFDAGVVSADAALRRGANLDSMRMSAARMRHWPDARDVVPVVDFADAGAESPGESLARIFVVAQGFPPPETQVVIRNGTFIARTDMKLRNLPILVEFDGRMKYRRKRDDCDPVVDDGEIVWAEKQREDELRGLDHAVFRLIWAELFGARRVAAGRRLWRIAERYGARRPWPLVG